MKNVKEMLKGVKTKKAVMDLVHQFNSKDLTEEGKSIIKYLLDLFNADMKDMKISEMKEEVLTLVSSKAFKDMDKATIIFENAIKPKAKVKSKEDEEAEALLNAMEKKKDVKKDTKKVTKEVKEAVKGLSPEQIFELCGYRYTYPVFPETFTSPILEDSKFHRVDESDPTKIQEMFDAMQNETGDSLVVAMYFPEYERDYDIDPHACLYANTTKKQALKKYGGKYPNNLDVQSMLHFDGDVRTLVTVSAFTGIPYAINCQQAVFETNDTLKCRVTQNGLDYQIYRVEAK